MDASLIYYTLNLLHRNIPIITVSTKVCQDKTEFIPPFLPIVFTFHNGIPEGVVENETGFLVPKRDITALSEKIGTLLANEQLRTEMGKKGRNLVLERFDNRKLVEELSEYYKFILTPL